VQPESGLRNLFSQFSRRRTVAGYLELSISKLKKGKL